MNRCRLSLCRLCLGLMFVGSCSAATQPQIDYIARYLDLKYDVIENKDDGSNVDVSLTLKNTGSEEIPTEWEIFFSHVRFVESGRLRNNDTGVTVDDFVFHHINGVLYKMATADSFSVLAAGAEKQVKFQAQNWIVSRTDVMPNWYVTAAGQEPRIIKSTAGESLSFVGAFDEEKKWKRYSWDEYSPYTPEERYELHEVSDAGGAPRRVIPTPVDDGLSAEGGSVDLTPDWTIVHPEGLLNEARFLAVETGLPMTTEYKSSRVIRLQTETPGGDEGDESYRLQVAPSDQTVVISANTSAGVFYGVQTFLALRSAGNSIPGGTIVDRPRYRWRGMHYDNARNYHGEGALYKMVDTMAMYKLNKLHLHLTDDEGWRLEIPDLPELTEVGGRRCHDLNETSCVIPQLGSSPTDTGPGSGFMTAEGYRDFLKYAEARHVVVIPEFDMPGHAHAAIIAMRARYNKYKDSNLTMAEEFVLEDPDDTSRYYSVQDFTDNAINPCLDSSYHFVEKVITEVKALHADIQPLDIFHFGGDEAAKEAWSDSPACDDLRQELGIWQNRSGEELKKYFVRRLAEIAVNQSMQFAGWEDGLYDGGTAPYNRSTLENTEVYANVWDNIWEWGAGERAYVLANNGYKVIMSQATHLYFDHPYEPDPEERGYYWATRFTDVKKTFGFLPDDLYANIDQERSGKPLTQEQVCQEMFTCAPLEKPENIVGMQGQVWSETIRTADQLYYMVFPRLLALAERAWHKASWETLADAGQRRTAMDTDWRDFANSLGYRELKRLDAMGVTYRVPSPGVKLQDGELRVTSGLPGLPQQYSTDEGATWADVRGTIPVQGDTTYHVVTRSADMSRASRVVRVTSGPVSAAVTASSTSCLQMVAVAGLTVVLLDLLNIC